MIQELNLKGSTAILVFGFNRPGHLQRLLDSLKANLGVDQFPLIVRIDGPRTDADREDVEAAISVAKTHLPLPEILVQTQNLGLARSVSEGVTATLLNYEQVIVLEDDLELSPHFLRFMVEGLERFKSDHRVASIHGYSIALRHANDPAYFLRGADCWGWATWRRSWETYNPDAAELYKVVLNRGLQKEFTFGGVSPHLELLLAAAEGTVDSWAIRWHASAFLDGKLTLYPSVSLVRNGGMDGSGTHSGTTGIYDSPLSKEPVELSSVAVKVSENAFRQHNIFYRKRRNKKKSMRLFRAAADGPYRIYRSFFRP